MTKVSAASINIKLNQKVQIDDEGKFSFYLNIKLTRRVQIDDEDKLIHNIESLCKCMVLCLIQALPVIDTWKSLKSARRLFQILRFRRLFQILRF